MFFGVKATTVEVNGLLADAEQRADDQESHPSRQVFSNGWLAMMRLQLLLAVATILGLFSTVSAADCSAECEAEFATCCGFKGFTSCHDEIKESKGSLAGPCVHDCTPTAQMNACADDDSSGSDCAENSAFQIR